MNHIEVFIDDQETLYETNTRVKNRIELTRHTLVEFKYQEIISFDFDSETSKLFCTTKFCFISKQNNDLIPLDLHLTWEVLNYNKDTDFMLTIPSGFSDALQFGFLKNLIFNRSLNKNLSVPWEDIFYGWDHVYDKSFFLKKIYQENHFKNSLFIFKMYERDELSHTELLNFYKIQFDEKNYSYTIEDFKIVSTTIYSRTLYPILLEAFLQSNAGFASQFENPELYVFCLNELNTINK